MENNNYENRRNTPLHKSQFGEGGKLLPQDKELEELNKEANDLNEQVTKIIMTNPNIIDHREPIGKDDSENV